MPAAAYSGSIYAKSDTQPFLVGATAAVSGNGTFYVNWVAPLVGGVFPSALNGAGGNKVATNMMIGNGASANPSCGDHVTSTNTGYFDCSPPAADITLPASVPMRVSNYNRAGSPDKSVPNACDNGASNTPMSYVLNYNLDSYTVNGGAAITTGFTVVNQDQAGASCANNGGECTSFTVAGVANATTIALTFSGPTYRCPTNWATYLNSNGTAKAYPGNGNCNNGTPKTPSGTQPSPPPARRRFPDAGGKKLKLQGPLRRALYFVNQDGRTDQLRERVSYPKRAEVAHNPASLFGAEGAAPIGYPDCMLNPKALIHLFVIVVLILNGIGGAAATTTVAGTQAWATNRWSLIMRLTAILRWRRPIPAATSIKLWRPTRVLTASRLAPQKAIATPPTAARTAPAAVAARISHRSCWLPSSWQCQPLPRHRRSGDSSQRPCRRPCRSRSDLPSPEFAGRQQAPVVRSPIRGQFARHRPASLRGVGLQCNRGIPRCHSIHQNPSGCPAWAAGDSCRAWLRAALSPASAAFRSARGPRRATATCCPAPSSTCPSARRR